MTRCEKPPFGGQGDAADQGAGGGADRQRPAAREGERRELHEHGLGDVRNRTPRAVREAQMIAAAERLFEEVAAAVRGAGDPERALRAGIEAFIAFADQQRATWIVLFGEGRFGEAAGAIRAEQSGPIAQLLRELPGWTGEPDAERLDAIAHVFVGAAESIAFWAVDHADVPLERVADHLMSALWPVVRELPSGGATGAPPPAPGRSAPSR